MLIFLIFVSSLTSRAESTDRESQIALQLSLGRDNFAASNLAAKLGLNETWLLDIEADSTKSANAQGTSSFNLGMDAKKVLLNWAARFKRGSFLMRIRSRCSRCSDRFLSP